MQPTHFCDQPIPWTKVQVISVGQNQAGIQLMELGRGDSFYARLGPHRSKDGCWDISVRGVKDPCAGSALASQ